MRLRERAHVTPVNVHAAVFDGLLGILRATLPKHRPKLSKRETTAMHGTDTDLGMVDSEPHSGRVGELPVKTSV